MSLEQKINYQLNKYPKVKKVIKRAYQRTMYAVSPKIKSEGNIVRVSPDDPNHEYFFGYYDKSPWDASDRYMLCLKAKDTWSDVSPKETADILLIDTEKEENDPSRYKKIAETRSWNVQQSCMLQWLGPDFSSKIIYNDFRDGKYVSVILSVEDGSERVIEAPVYTVSADGKTALTLDFSRLYNLRPGYGYYNVPEKTKGVALPDTTAVWKINLETGEVQDLLKYTDFASFEPRHEMAEEGSVHKVNHLMISPNGKRFMVLYRWFIGQRKYTRLITCNVDGTDMYVLSDDDMVSHCCWMNNSGILAFENKKETGSGYYLMKDKTQKYVQYWKGIDFDGHPSFSPDGSHIVFDRYPDKARVAAVFVSDAKDRKKKDVQTVARVFAPFKYDNDTRCDLHPRWNREGNKICFDSVFEGHRGLYTVSVDAPSKKKNIEHYDSSNDATPKYSIVTPMFNSFDLMKRYFKSLENQTYKNFEVILVDDCSTDGSYEKALEYAQNSNLNISVFRTEVNGGPGNARNIGMKAAHGEWLTFIDNDDWVEQTALEELNTVVDHNDVNCVIFDYYLDDGKQCLAANSMYKGDMGKISLPECMLYTRNHTFGKLYKLSMCKAKEIYFPDIRRCEDVAFVCRAIEACGSPYYYKKQLYHYYQRHDSLSNNTRLDESDMVKAFAVLEKELGDAYPKVLEGKSVTDLLYGGVLMMCKAHKNSKEIEEYISEYESRYPNWRKSSMLSEMGGGKETIRQAMRNEKYSDAEIDDICSFFTASQLTLKNKSTKKILSPHEDTSYAPLISIIIPLFNEEQHIARCIKSLLEQTYRNIEIIIIDDGSTDSSQKICKHFLDYDNRIIYIKQKNGGASKARNTGIEKARGDLIGFVDSDDWVSSDMFEYLYGLMKKYKADAVQIDYQMVDSEKKVNRIKRKEHIDIYKGKNILEYFMLSSTVTGSYSLWRCLFRSEIIKNVHFREGKIHEDIDYKYKALNLCSIFVVSNQCKYYYWQEGNSVSTGGLKARDFDLYDSAEELYALTQRESYGNIKKLGEVKKARTAFSLLSKIAYYGISDNNFNREQIVEKLVQEHKKNALILVQAPIGIRRKILVLLFAIDFNFACKVIKLGKILKAI